MKKVIIVFLGVLLVLVLASCVSTNVGNNEKDFTAQLVPQYAPGDPIPLMSNGTQVGTVTVTIPAGRIFVKYETNHRMELVDEKIFEEGGALYNQYYTTNPPDRFSFEHIIEKPYLDNSVIKILVWVSNGCNYYRAYLEFTLSGGLGAVPAAAVTANPRTVKEMEYDWTIEKTATPHFQYIFALETKAFDYEVKVDKIPGVATDTHTVGGTLEVWEALGLDPLTVLGIEISLTDAALIPITSIIVPPSGNVINPPNHEFYPYSMDVTGLVSPGLNYFIVAEVQTDAGPTNAQAGPFQFPDVPATTIIDNEAFVDDDYLHVDLLGNSILNVIGYPFPQLIDTSTVFNYSMKVTNLGVELDGYISNTATVTEQDTGENDSDSELVEYIGDCPL